MPNQAQHGNAFEYALFISLEDSISEWIKDHGQGQKAISLIEDDRYRTIKNSFNTLPESLKQQMVLASKKGWKKILDMEPRMTHATIDDPLVARINSNAGMFGDIRDVLFLRRLGISRRRRQTYSELAEPSETWEIGISAKWNHDALKHSRLSDQIDFGQKWLNHDCSEKYWEEMEKPISILQRNRGSLWRNLPEKINSIYKPIMEAFMKELMFINDQFPDVPKRLVEYIVSRYDFYKVKTAINRRMIDIQPFNLYGTLNQDDLGVLPIISIPSEIGVMPNRIIHVGWKTDSNTTIEIILDNGWQFHARVHNADTLINPSVKLDIRFAGSPFPIYTENW